MIKSNVAIFFKAYESILQNAMVKEYKHFQRTNKNTSHTKHRKKFMSSKKNNKWAIHAISSPCSYEVDETMHIPTENSKNNTVVVKLLSNPIANVYVNVHYEQTSIWNLKQARKYLSSRTEATITINTMK